MIKSAIAVQKEYDDYAYAVSHDLGAPIRQIKAFLGLLFDDIENGTMDDINDYRDQCYNAINHADLILARLYEYSQLNSHILNLKSQKIIDFLPNDTRIKINIDPDITTMMDADLFQTIINELTDNALKFSDGVTEIFYNKKTLIFKTYGVTIPQDYYDAIFNPLRTLHPKNTNMGCGMGLAIIKKCADMQNMQCRCKGGNDYVEFELIFP